MTTPLNDKQNQALGRMMVEGFKKGDAGIIEGLLKRGGDPDVQVQDGDSGSWRPVLHWGAYYFNEQGMQAMLDHGANIEVPDSNGNTALMYAISGYKLAAVEFLMKHGANPLAQNGDGVVALDVARRLDPDYASWREVRDKMIKALSADYSTAQEQAPAPQAPPAPVTFPAKPKDQKFHV